MQQRIEQIILKNLIHNEEYSRKVLPFLNKEYFIEPTDKILYEQVNAFINKYNNLPTKEALIIELDDTPLKEEEFEKKLGEWVIEIIQTQMDKHAAKDRDINTEKSDT